MKITTILPVSRIEYLDRVIESLLKQTYKINNLVVVFDGNDEEFIQVRNKVIQLDIENKLCVKSTNRHRAHTIAERRWHIVNIHNQIREIIGDSDWIFSVEDDGLLPSHALASLVKVVKEKEDVGMVTGVELGRWGLPYVGAWCADDIHETRQITSLESKTNEPLVEEIDACGLYCALIRADLYKEHKFYTQNGLGPDVNLGLYLRQQGYRNFIDWNIPVIHLTNRKGRQIEIPADSESKVISLKLLSGSTWKQQKSS